MNALRGVFALVITAVAACAATFWIGGSHLIAAAHESVGPAPADMQEVTFQSNWGQSNSGQSNSGQSNLGQPNLGVALKGWFSPVQRPKALAVVMHGVKGNRVAMLGRVRFLNRLGLSTLAFDFQAHGESEGTAITFGHLESRDAQAAVAYIRHYNPALPVFVIGVSLGGAAALLADPPLAVQGMILEAVYPEITTAVANRLAMRLPYAEILAPLFTLQLDPRIGVTPAQLSPVNAAQRTFVPVLLLAGTEDRHTTTEDTERLLQAFPGSKQVAFFKGAAHVNLHAYDNIAYEALVSRAIERWLQADSAPTMAPDSVAN